MKKSDKKIKISPDEAEFYTLDKSKPIAAEGHRTAIPLILLFFALFFCAIYAFIYIVSRSDGSYEGQEQSFSTLFIVCCVLLGAAVLLNVAYIVRKIVIKRSILASDVTAATVTSASISTEHYRDKDGDNRTRERVALTYAFYDRNGKLREEKFYKVYKGSAPEFYEGQKIIVAFDNERCYVLSKYTLMSSDGNPTNALRSKQVDDNYASISSEPLNIKKMKLSPLGYEKKYYVYGGVYFAFFLGFLAFLIGKAVTETGQMLLFFVFGLGIFCVVFLALTLQCVLIPFTAKRRHNGILRSNPDYANGKIVSSNILYGSGGKNVYLCIFIDKDGNERNFKVRRDTAKYMVRYGNVDVVVAYTADKAVALVKEKSRSK